jgi:AcrR family transcriptional regulator
MRANRRAEILDATAALMVERGYHGVSVGSIARASRVSRQAVYAHFGSKPRLLLALVERAGRAAGVAEVAAEPTEASPPAAFLDAAVDGSLASSAGARSVLRALDAARSTDADAAMAWQTLLAERLRSLRAVAGRLADTGALHPAWTVGAAADLMLTMTSASTVEQLIGDRGWSLEQCHARVRRSLRRTLLTDSARDEPM